MKPVVNAIMILLFLVLVLLYCMPRESYTPQSVCDAIYSKYPDAVSTMGPKKDCEKYLGGKNAVMLQAARECVNSQKDFAGFGPCLEQTAIANETCFSLQEQGYKIQNCQAAMQPLLNHCKETSDFGACITNSSNIQRFLPAVSVAQAACSTMQDVAPDCVSTLTPVIHDCQLSGNYESCMKSHHN